MCHAGKVCLPQIGMCNAAAGMKFTTLSSVLQASPLRHGPCCCDEYHVIAIVYIRLMHFKESLRPGHGGAVVFTSCRAADASLWAVRSLSLRSARLAAASCWLRSRSCEPLGEVSDIKRMKLRKTAWIDDERSSSHTGTGGSGKLPWCGLVPWSTTRRKKAACFRTAGGLSFQAQA